MPPSDTPDPRLADAIRRLREDRGLTQEDVAYRCGLSVSAYARIERAAVNPTWTTVVRVAEALDIGLVDLARTITDHLADL